MTERLDVYLCDRMAGALERTGEYRSAISPSTSNRIHLPLFQVRSR